MPGSPKPCQITSHINLPAAPSTCTCSHHDTVRNLSNSFLTPENLKILQLNVRGINEIDKFNEICALVSTVSCLPDVLVFSETKLKETFPRQIYSIPGFNTFCCSRSAGSGGGVLVYVRSSIPVDANPLPPASFERLSLTLNLDTCRFRLLAVYRAPTSSNLVEFLDDLENFLSISEDN